MPHFQTIVTLFIVTGAAFFLVRRVYKNLKKSGSSSCGCGCSGCNVAQGSEGSRSNGPAPK